MIEELHGERSMDSPILFIGDSLPKNPINMTEILDKKDGPNNSIIESLKNYINDYLMQNHKLKLPSDWNNENGIFKFVNAIENPQDKIGTGPVNDKYSLIINKMKEEILDGDGHSKYRMIVCMGDFTYFATRTLFGLYHGKERQAFPKNRSKFTIGKSGEFHIEDSRKDSLIIFPILHSVSNVKPEATIEILPESKKNLCENMNYLVYVAKEIADIIVNDAELKSYLITLQ